MSATSAKGICPQSLGLEYQERDQCEPLGKSQHIPTKKAGKAYKASKAQNKQTSKQASKSSRVEHAACTHTQMNKPGTGETSKQ